MNIFAKLAIAAAVSSGAVATLSVSRPLLLSASSLACRGPDAFSDIQIRHLKHLMTTTDNVEISFRQRVLLPLVADSAIALVTNDSVCSAAVATWRDQDSVAYAQLQALYVIRVGSMYDTIDPAAGSEWSQHLVMDGVFQRATVYLY